MRPKPKYFFAALLFLAAVILLPTFSQAEASPTPLLGDILKKTEAYYQQTKAFTAYFRQYTTSSAASAMSTTEAGGRLYYEKPRQMRWEYEKPEPQVFVANQQLAWFYSPTENHISMFDAKAFFASPLAQTFFDGMVQLRKHFDVTLDPLQSNRTSAVLRLSPKKEDPGIKSLILRIDLRNYHITTIETYDALGNTNRIVLDSQAAVSDLDPRLFELEVPPSAVVTDLDGRELPPADVDKLRQKLLSPDRNNER